MAKDIYIGVNDEGRRVGQDHHRAKLTDEEVECVRQLRELKNPDGSHQWTHRDIAKAFKVSVGAVHKICEYQMRNQHVSAFRKVHIKPDDR